MKTHKTNTDAKFCNLIFKFLDRVTKEIDANQLLLTPEFLQYTTIITLMNNTQIYYGSNFQNYDIRSFIKRETY